MSKTIQNLLTEVDSNITANNNAEITGTVLNGVLKSIIGNLNNYILFPLDAGVSSADIGKLMMNDGSGTAKVYQLSPATTAQTGRFIIKLQDLNDLSNNSNISIDTLSFGKSFGRDMWRNGSTPTTALEELELIKDYIDNDSQMANLATSIVNGELVIEETNYDFTALRLNDFQQFSLVIDSLSRPALPAAPTAFPIGKLIGVEGTSALISTNAMETYMLDGLANINNSFFNNETDIDFNNMDDLMAIANFLVIPAGNGKVKILDPNEINFDNSFIHSFRHHIVGIALNSTSNTLTVVQMNHLSFIGHLIKRIAAKGLFNN